MEKKKVSYSFGSRGWGLIIFTGLCMFINGMIHTNGINIIYNILVESKGWERATLLNLNTIAGIIGVCFTFVIGRLIVKFGAKKVGGPALIIGGAMVMWFGHVNSIFAFFICLTLLWCCTDAFGQMVPYTLNANWFPRKKGMALGFSTMGYPFGTIFAVTLLLGLISWFGYGGGFIALGIIHMILGVILLVLVKNHPEEAGCYPDNDPTGLDELKKSEEARKNYRSELTVKKLFKDPNMWCIAIAMGLLWLITIGIVSQLLPRMMMIGYDQAAATRFLQLSGLAGIFGSYFYGWLDQKIGTRKATLLYCGNYIVVLFAMIFGTGSFGLTLFAVVFGGFGVGAVCNLLPSYIGTVFGNKDFAVANGVIAPIASLIRCCNFLILGLGLAINGTYTPSYMLMVGFCIVAFVLVLRTKKVHPSMARTDEQNVEDVSENIGEMGYGTANI